VPSSTSNSKQRLPHTPVARFWCFVVLCFVLMLGVIETAARFNGYQPMVQDSKELWAYHRYRATKAGESSIVLLGASRIQNGMVPEVLSRSFPDSEIAMLALAGHDVRAILEDLASDDAFTGTVIWSTTALWLKGDFFWQTLTPNINFYENEWSTRLLLSTRVQVTMQEHLAMLHEGLSFEALEARLSGKPYRNMTFSRASRYRELHRTNADDIERIKARANAIYKDTLEATPFPSPEEMVQHYERIEVAVRTLVDKGCRVVVVRMPSSGQVWELEQQHMPKELYWDRFAELTRAETYHFKDHPSLSEFECSDNTHLDYPDAVRFTDAFAQLVVANSITPKPE